MDDLPPPLLLAILSRIPDSTDLARCRLTCKTLNSLSYEVNSINLQCSFDRYIRSRSQAIANSSLTPFKSIFKSLISRLNNLESVSIGVEKPLRGILYDDVEDDSDDLYLTGVDFVADCLPRVSARLRSLSVSDFWVQSCWRRSDLLALVSQLCNGLLELEVKNAWLSVDGLTPMPKLTSLTLEFIRLDDSDLSKVNECFPCLRVLNLIGVGGLKEPKIHLQHLKSCQWTISNAPLSLSVVAPNLIDLKLKCVKPRSLVLDAPLLSRFHLAMDESTEMCVKKGPLELKRLHLESGNLYKLIRKLPFCKTVRSLSLDSDDRTEHSENTRLSLDILFRNFPNLSSLSLGQGVYTELESCFGSGCSEPENNKIGCLEEFKARLVVSDAEDFTLSFIFHILERCVNLSTVALLVHQELDYAIASGFISKCVSACSRVRWKWGLWKEGNQDTWVSDGV